MPLVVNDILGRRNPAVPRQQLGSGADLHDENDGELIWRWRTGGGSLLELLDPTTCGLCGTVLEDAFPWMHCPNDDVYWRTE